MRNAGAGAWSPTDLAVSANGASPITGVPTAANGNLTTVQIGSVAGAAPIFGYIERLAIYPYRAANLPQMSTLANWGG